MSLPKKIIYSLIPVIVLLVVLEGVCLVWERFDPASAEMPKPERLPEKEPGEFRVLFYGGSTVAGEPVAQLGFVKQMERYLEELFPERPIRLINFGAGGRNSTYVVWKMVQTLPQSEADAIVILTGHNEFLFEHELNEAELNWLFTLQENMHRSALFRRARRLYYRYYISRREEVLKGENLSRYDRESARFKGRIEIYRRNLDIMTQHAEMADKPIFLCTGPSNVAESPPAQYTYSRHGEDEDYVQSIHEIVSLSAERHGERRLELAGEAMRRFPGDAILTFLAGKTELAAGATERARKLLYEARDIDPVPHRVLSVFNEAVRAQHDPPATRVVDVERIFDQHSAHGITGFGLMADHCHPAPEGNFLIATSLIDAFAEAGLLELDGASASLVSLEQFLGDLRFFEDRSKIRIRYYLQNGHNCMKPPYLNFVASRQYFELALGLDPENWEAWANLATIHLFKEEATQAEECLRRAVRAKGSPINVHDKKTVPLLEQAIKRGQKASG